jgi:serine/threonine protein kinase
MSEFPQALDRFQILRILGKGGMGTVYLARDQRLGRQVALKVLNAEDLDSDDRRARFMREARTAAGIRHQNVATIYEVDETDDGQPFIVMEYCEGETLAQRLRRSSFQSNEFLSVARQIAAGLAAAHAAGVVHRDIKSANVIIEPNGLVKILDFGLAKLLQRELAIAERTTIFESTSGHFFGTLHYLSPEQARGLAADERSDLFAVGILFYQMASGQLPFSADSALMVLEKIRDAEPAPFVPLDSSFPAPVIRIIGRLLQKSPSDRYQSASELLHDLEDIDTPTVRLTHNTISNTLGRTVPRPRHKQIILALIGLLALVSGIWYARERTDKAEVAAQAPKPLPPIRSMAVLPLDNLAHNSRDDFLSVGLADALTTKLQKIPSLQVRPTSAVMQFHEKKVDARTAGSVLQVDGILEGHFLAAGDLVRVTLQLTDTRTGYNVWADEINGKRTDLLKLIDEVSSRTVTGLNERLGVQPEAQSSSEARSSNPRAYEEYLKARSLNGSLVPSQFNAEIAALRRAISLDPNFAAAYADLAIALSLGQTRALTTEPDAIEKAEWYARQAVRLDPNLPQAHLALGRVFIRFPERFRESVRENLAALRLDTNDVPALGVLTTYFISDGDTQKAQCVGDRLVALDPLSNDARTRSYWSVNAVEPEQALENSKWALASKDTELAGHDVRGLAFIMMGDLNQAETEAAAVSKLVPKHYLGKSLRAMIAAARGDRAAAEAHIATFVDDANHAHWATIRVAMCYAKLGDRDKAISWLKRSAELGHHSWYALIKHPWWQPYQSDPELQQILGKMKADLDDVHDDVIGVYQLICK